MRGARIAIASLIPVVMSLPARALDPLNWAPRNHAVLQRLIQQVGKGSRSYSSKRPPYAVFDWDNTSAFLDCQDVTLRYQVQHVAFRLTPDELATLLPDEIRGVRQVTIDGRTIRLADMNADILAAYVALLTAREDDPSQAGLAAIRQMPAFQDFVTKLPLLYEAYCDTPAIGPTYAYPWVTYLLAGYTPAEVRTLATAAITESLGAAIESVTWPGPKALASRCGPLSFHFRSGLRVQPEMQDLMARLREAGIGVYVVSASLKPVVEAFAGPGQFGYNVPADHVIAMETAVRDGVLRPAYKPGWVPTVGPGKVAAIRRVLGRFGDPVLGAGDSDGDVEMLRDFAGMHVALVFNRVKGGAIGALCRAAVAEKDKAMPRFLLQGRNENDGLLAPTMGTIRFGQSEPTVLKAD